MFSFTRFRPPSKINILKEQLPEQLKRTINATNRISHGTQAYVYNRTVDKQEIELSIYRQRYPDNWKRELKTLSRVKLQPGLFVTNEENDIDQDFKVREALVYGVFEQVYSPQNPDTQVLAYCSSKNGIFKMPRVVIERDDLDNIMKSEVQGWQNMFYIPWDDGKSAKAVLDGFGGSYKNTVLAIAAPAGDSWHAGNTLSVFNLQEWLTLDWDDLASANRAGFLKPEYGGVVLHKKDKAAKEEKMRKEIEELKNQKK
ncbi:MAG: hypothetical protein ACRD47_05270 [Nitrososphaeraceae archaeon]